MPAAAPKDAPTNGAALLAVTVGIRKILAKTRLKSLSVGCTGPVKGVVNVWGGGEDSKRKRDYTALLQSLLSVFLSYLGEGLQGRKFLEVIL